MFIKNLASLMTGSLLAQAIPLMALPILTRMYTPEEFGLLALYAAMASILSVVATARYEQAVILAKNKSDYLEKIGRNADSSISHNLYCFKSGKMELLKGKFFY